ncbi:FAD:protein FMN transferase [Terrimonas sp. NA20]|uniref:FAD:protein FMN transferase n=1 Tax=Terrimonas ginsenosidimutans TaxID=2908004 RepID=A0ABS9KSZ3_9BACT|nr:FAD:protein FMN transferase [Terrimonas ginsenosidimutans]MCG2615449.1 FAD:protein FMN transferase [Terrimonas ginsenosidimutans]
MSRCFLILICCIAFFVLPAFNTARGKELLPFYVEGIAQGTTYHITYYAESERVSKSQVDSVFKSIDRSLSIYQPGSLINRFNESADGILMDQHLRNVVKKSMFIGRSTNGVFDITVLPLVQAWGFGVNRKVTPPDSVAIRSLLDCVGSAKLLIKGNYLEKRNACVKIDVNGIAQGYSVDVLAGFFETKNVRNYLVEVGGEIRVRGKKYPGASAMRIGIEAPAKTATDSQILQHVMEIPGGAVTTSGNYRKYHASDGKKITHLISPATGYPFTNELLSVTVWARDAITADGYDNALMGMGLKEAFAFLSKHRDIEAFFIYKDNSGMIRDTATAKFYQQIIK